MKPALIEIEEKLLSTGMKLDEVQFLMSRFLEEESINYLEVLVEVEKTRSLINRVFINTISLSF